MRSLDSCFENLPLEVSVSTPAPGSRGSPRCLRRQDGCRPHVPRPRGGWWSRASFRPGWEERRELSWLTCLPRDRRGAGDGGSRFLLVGLRAGAGKLLINWSQVECLRKERTYGAQGTATKWMAPLPADRSLR